MVNMRDWINFLNQTLIPLQRNSRKNSAIQKFEYQHL